MKNSNQIQNNESGPRQLPIKEMNGKSYYVDERLQQYRNVHNPHDIINFNGDHVLVYTSMSLVFCKYALGVLLYLSLRTYLP